MRHRPQVASQDSAVRTTAARTHSPGVDLVRRPVPRFPSDLLLGQVTQNPAESDTGTAIRAPGVILAPQICAAWAPWWDYYRSLCNGNPTIWPRANGAQKRRRPATPHSYEYNMCRTDTTWDPHGLPRQERTHPRVRVARRSASSDRQIPIYDALSL